MDKMEIEDLGRPLSVFCCIHTCALCVICHNKTRTVLDGLDFFFFTYNSFACGLF